ALHQVAAKRGYPFVDLYELLGTDSKSSKTPLTDNGMHLTPYGYWRSAAAVEQGLGLEPPRRHLEIGKDGKATSRDGGKVADIQTSPLRFQVTDAALPTSPPPKETSAGKSLPRPQRVLRIQGLAPGEYALHIDGRATVTATAAAWTAGVNLTRGPEFDQVER